MGQSFESRRGNPFRLPVMEDGNKPEPPFMKTLDIRYPDTRAMRDYSTTSDFIGMQDGRLKISALRSRRHDVGKSTARRGNAQIKEDIDSY